MRWRRDSLKRRAVKTNDSRNSSYDGLEHYCHSFILTTPTHLFTEYSVRSDEAGAGNSPTARRLCGGRDVRCTLHLEPQYNMPLAAGAWPQEPDHLRRDSAFQERVSWQRQICRPILQVEISAHQQFMKFGPNGQPSRFFLSKFRLHRK
jgi:hypothetical protein